MEPALSVSQGLMARNHSNRAAMAQTAVRAAMVEQAAEAFWLWRGVRPVTPPVLAALRSRFDAVLSVDTGNAQVIREATTAGAGLINDVRALRQPGALAAAASSGLPVCLMHMQGIPGTMQQAPVYVDVVAEVTGFLQARMQTCMGAGIESSRLLIDPGFGFGKSLQHNLVSPFWRPH